MKATYHSTSDTKEREKALVADNLEQSIYTVKWSMSLSVNCDVYEVFGIGINILQVVNSLPFQTYDKFKKHVIERYKLMLKSIKIEDCPCATSMGVVDTDSEDVLEPGEVLQEDISDDENGNQEDTPPVSEKFICYWPTYHKDLKDLQEDNMYQQVPMGVLVAERFKTRAAHAQNSETMLLDRESIIKQVETRAEEVTRFLQEGLEEKTFRPEDIKVIEHCRTVLDLESTMQKCVLFGSPHTANVTWKKFQESAKFFDPTLNEKVY